MNIPEDFRKSLQVAMIEWYQQAQRDLPWRRTRDPYAIVVSELMLQQTQVSKVIPFYERFMQTFPTLESLAQAAEEEVLRHWSGLGYYRRAHHLLALAREVVKSSQGKFPKEKKRLLALPGIGEYTAGAILSIAFDIPCVLVDGNVERVLARIFCCEKDLSLTEGKKALWNLADQLVPETGAGTFNQALMELGATLCLPGQPSCLLCPIQDLCGAFKQGRMTHFPVKSRTTKKVQVSELVLLIERHGSWLLTTINQENLYPGMWQFPWVWIDPGMNDPTQALEDLAGTLGIANAEWSSAHQLKHGVTFRSISTRFFRTRIKRKPTQGSAYRWVKTGDLPFEALPSYQKKVIDHLES